MRKRMIASSLAIVTIASVMGGCSRMDSPEKSTNPVESVSSVGSLERVENVSQCREWPQIISFDDIANHTAVWQNFVKGTKEHKEQKVTIGNSYESMKIEYSGNMYRYSNGTEHKEYKYLQELNGTMPNASCESHFVVLTNKKYSFEEISKSTYSNDSEEAFIDYQLIYWY